MDGDPGSAQIPRPAAAPPASRPAPEQTGEDPSPIRVMFATGALDRGIARLAYAVRGREHRPRPGGDRLHTIKAVLVATLADEAEGGGSQ